MAEVMYEIPDDGQSPRRFTRFCPNPSIEIQNVPISLKPKIFRFPVNFPVDILSAIRNSCQGLGVAGPRRGASSCLPNRGVTNDTQIPSQKVHSKL